jgi:HAD superfamily hydrolase (TIGR01457 family)
MTDFAQLSIAALILDMDGVLWRGTEPIGDLKSIFSKISAIGWKFIFVTNNATRTVQQYMDLLKSFSIIAEPWQIVNSAMAATLYLKTIFPDGGPVYIIGEQGILEACQNDGYYHSETGALAVVAGIDRNLTYEKLRVATLLLRSGVPFVGTNPDRTFPTPQGLVPGAGSILAALTTASDVIPVIVGKPEPAMYKIALQRLGVSAERVLVVGDRPETDMAGAQLIGCHTALVLSGVTSLEQAKSWQPAPDMIVEDLETLVHLRINAR